MRADYTPSTNENVVSQYKLPAGWDRKLNKPTNVGLISYDELALLLRNINPPLKSHAFSQMAKTSPPNRPIEQRPKQATQATDNKSNHNY
jgi:hypothetical protein